jgi:hypothetical protein
MKHFCLVLLLALLAIPLAAQDRVLTAAELSAGAFNVTIGAGGSLSDSVAVGKACTPIGLQMPAAWTDAVITFRAAVSSETPQSLYDGFATEVTLTVAAARYVVLDPSQFLGIRVIQLRSGTAASAVNQAAARTVRVVCR